MPARFVSIDHDTPLLLAPNLRDWVPANPLCLFIVDAVEVESLLIVGQRVSDAPNDKEQDRKSTRLNSSHLVISYAVFCLKKKNQIRSAGELCMFLDVSIMLSRL